jgi:hypothetical protein
MDLRRFTTFAMCWHPTCTALQLRSQVPQEEAEKQARGLSVDWLSGQAYTIWPKVARSGDFDWTALFDPGGSTGRARLNAQSIRANISPLDCCVATAAGTSAWRLRTDESGVGHLYLAGTWINTGFNTECVETAVISGMQAARAITGDKREIPGEAFLHAPRQLLSICDWLQLCALTSAG